MFHEETCSTAFLFKQLCPNGTISAPLLRRLKRLGIDKTDPKDLTEGKSPKPLTLCVYMSMYTLIIISLFNSLSLSLSLKCGFNGEHSWADAPGIDRLFFLYLSL